MTTLRLLKVVEYLANYEIEVEIQDTKDIHYIGVIVSKPITLAKVKTAIQAVYQSSPGTGSNLRTAYWEGREIVL